LIEKFEKEERRREIPRITILVVALAKGLRTARRSTITKRKKRTTKRATRVTTVMIAKTMMTTATTTKRRRTMMTRMTMTVMAMAIMGTGAGAAPPLRRGERRNKRRLFGGTRARGSNRLRRNPKSRYNYHSMFIAPVRVP